MARKLSTNQDLVGQTISHAKNRGEWLVLVFESGDFCFLHSDYRGPSRGSTVSADHTIADSFMVEFGAMTQEEADRNKLEAEKRYQDYREKEDRTQLAALKAKYEGT